MEIKKKYSNEKEKNIRRYKNRLKYEDIIFEYLNLQLLIQRNIFVLLEIKQDKNKT